MHACKLACCTKTQLPSLQCTQQSTASAYDLTTLLLCCIADVAPVLLNSLAAPQLPVATVLHYLQHQPQQASSQSQSSNRMLQQLAGRHQPQRQQGPQDSQEEQQQQQRHGQRPQACLTLLHQALWS